MEDNIETIQSPHTPESLSEPRPNWAVGAFLGMADKIKHIQQNHILTDAIRSIDSLRQNYRNALSLTFLTLAIATAGNIEPIQQNNQHKKQTASADKPSLIDESFNQQLPWEQTTPSNRTSQTEKKYTNYHTSSQANQPSELKHTKEQIQLTPTELEKQEFAQSWIESQRFLLEHGQDALGVSSDIHPSVIQAEVLYWKNERGAKINDPEHFSQEIFRLAQASGQSAGFLMTIWQHETGWGTATGPKEGYANWGNYAYSVGRNNDGSFPDDPKRDPLHNAECILGQFNLYQNRDGYKTYNQALAVYSPAWDNQNLPTWQKDDAQRIQSWREQSKKYVAQDLNISVTELEVLIRNP